MKAVRRQQTWIPTKNTRICGVHFEDKCFNKNGKKRKRLCEDAIPTLNFPKFVSRASALLSRDECNGSGLVNQKDKGKLIHPSNDTILIGRCCESELRKGVNENNKLKKEWTTALLLPQVCDRVKKHQLFKDIDFHRNESEDIDHLEELEKAIAQIYLNTRIAFIRKQAVKKNSKKNIYKKLVHNKSQ